MVGGGPAGLEAARVSAERGHRVVLMEAGARFGGQILVAAYAAERRDLIGIVAWRRAELERLGVATRLHTMAERDDVLAEAPDAVIVATGGVPDLDWLPGAELCDSVWDVLTGVVQAKHDVLVYDGTGRQAAPSCALHLAGAGRSVTIATPDDALAVEMPYADRTGFRKEIALRGIRSIVDARLIRVERAGNGLVAILRNEYTGQETGIETAQVVVEHGTVPMDVLYHDLRGLSANDGVTRLETLMGRPGAPADLAQAEGFTLHRIGDAVSSRDIHSAIHDAYRICSAL